MPDQTLSLGFSPCPNDTFIFHALVHGLVAAPGLRFTPRLEDVETLNQRALDAVSARDAGSPHTALRDPAPDVTKISYGALPHLLDDYALLRSGGALGKGCGPLLVVREAAADAGTAALRRIAIPGRLTTANLLLRLWQPTLPAGEELVYSEILPAVARGDFDAGLIIHESRFTYAGHGLHALVDLGAWWEEATGHAIPLGGIVARRALGAERLRRIEAAVRRSVEHAFAHPDASAAYVRRHAQEMAPDVTRQHIELYVNPYSLDLGADGEAAVRDLLRRAAAVGLAPESAADPFA
jgi:1,4-dihydroxy-6-naphthoate synthase